MAKRYAVVFGVVGYLLVIWFFIVNPLGHTLNVLFRICPVCPIVEGFGRRPLLYAMIFGPINAAMFGAAGFVIGKFANAIRIRQQRQS